MFDLTGIPHAIAAIHSRRHQPVDYVSEYYKREIYMTTYQYLLEAIRGRNTGTSMLMRSYCLDIPKKLRGRPKKLRRRETWEGGSRIQETPSQGVILQRFSNKRVMYCSNYRQEGHRVSKCLGKDEAKVTVGNNENAENEKQNSASKRKRTTNPKKKAAKELKRQKLTVRRPVKGIKINEPQRQSSQTGRSKVKEASYTGKDKAQAPESESENESDHSDNDVWRLFEDDYFGHED